MRELGYCQPTKGDLFVPRLRNARLDTHSFHVSAPVIPVTCNSLQPHLKGTSINRHRVISVLKTRLFQFDKLQFMLVLNNRESIEEVFLKHASSFSGRESFYTEKYVCNIGQKAAMITLIEFLIFTGSFLSLIVIIRLRNGKGKPRLPYPPSFPSLPIVGSLPFIEDFEALAEYFLKKSYELGPVFSLRFGSRFVLVLNNRESIEDALVKQASSFSGRESFYTDKYVCNIGQKGIGSMNYNAEFKKYQRLNVTILKNFGFGSKKLIETRILLEVGGLLKHFKATDGAPIDPKEAIVLGVSNVMNNIIFGKRQRYEEGLSEVCAAMVKYVVNIEPALDLFPILRFFPPYNKKLKAFKCAFATMAYFLEKEIAESLKDGCEDHFVRKYVENEGQNYDYEQLKFTVRDFIVAGTDTTSNTILWALILLANHPNIMVRAQKEIDSVVPRGRLPAVADEPLMPYVQATILEILRYRCVLPLSIPHLSLHDTEVLGYFVPADTVVLPNLHAANLNRNDWHTAEVFSPERFLDTNNKLINKELVITFSLGRRSCLGESLARQQLFLFISAILQNFTIQPPDGVSEISDKANHGVTLTPSPFEIRLIARNE